MNSRHPTRERTNDEPGHGSLVVGFDGSPSSHEAVRWAADEAAERHAALRVMSCSVVPDAVDFYGVGHRQSAALAAIVADAAAEHPGLDVASISTHLDPRDALVSATATGDLLVVGASTSGTAKAWLFGSVPRTASRNSACPVVVVRGRTSRPIRRVVVGVDSSNASLAATDWAAEMAERHDAQLAIVHAWQPTDVRFSSARAGELVRQDAQCVVDLAVERCADRFGVVADGSLVQGPADKVLEECSRDAEMIVVGSRGRSGFRTLLFGSVALAISEHAECPVAVIHPRVDRHHARGG